MDQARKKALVIEAKKVLNKWGFKATFSTTRHSITCLLRSGPLDIIADYNAAKNKSPRYSNLRDLTSADTIEVNVYYIHDHFSGQVKQFLTELKDALHTGNHDKSDISTDYFDVGWYVYIKVGKYQTPYNFIPSMAKATPMKSPRTSVPGQLSGDYDVSNFTYDVLTKTFISEASTLGWKVGEDKAPKHMMLKGKTSKKVLYVRQTHNELGEPIARGEFHYVPTKNSLDWTPACTGTKIKVFNT